MSIATCLFRIINLNELESRHIFIFKAIVAELLVGAAGGVNKLYVYLILLRQAIFMLSLQIAVFIGPILACLFSIFGFCLSLSNTPFAFRWLHYVSYFRAGFHVAVHSVYGFNRTNIHCAKGEHS